MTSFFKNNTSYSNPPDTNDRFVQPLNFWVFLILDVPAVMCSIFALYHLLKDRQLRTALHNHVTILILLFNLIYQLVDIPLHLQYFSTGIVRPATPALCLIWLFIDYGFFFTDLVLLMWASFERHILIFHTSMLTTQRRRLFVHYLPIFVIVMFMMLFYGVVIFAPPCQNTFDFTMDTCGTGGCYNSVPFFGMVERIGFAIVPTFLIAIFCMALIIRIIRQKYRIRGIIEWRRQRKLIVQLVSMSSVYLFFDMPLSIVDLVHLSGQPDWGHDALPAIFYLSYFPILLLPIVCLGSIPELWNKVKKYKLRRPQRVAMATTNY